MHASRVRVHLALLVLWTAAVAVAAQSPPPPLSVASIQAQLAALKAQLPPNCVGSSFLQRTATGWACVTPVGDLSAAGWCRAAPEGGGVTCDAAPPLAAPPRCLPPGGSWLGFNSSAGGWVCVCKPGWAGTTCTTPAATVSIPCGPPPPCASGLYNLVAGVFSCVAAPAPLPPPAPPSSPVLGISSLFAYYNAASFTTSNWLDLSGNQRNGTVHGAVSRVQQSGNGASTSFAQLQSATGSDFISFPWTFPTTFTMCSMSRAVTATAGRVLSGPAGTNVYNWGHDCAGSNLVAGFQAPTMNAACWGGSCTLWAAGGVVPVKTDWVWMCGTNDAAAGDMYVNGFNFRNVSGFQPGFTADTLQVGGFGSCGSPQWAVAEVAVWNRALTAAEYATVLAYFQSTYGLTNALIPPAPPPSPPALISAGSSWSSQLLKSSGLGLCWTVNPAVAPSSGILLPLFQECAAYSNQLISLELVTSSYGYGTGLTLTTVFGGSKWQLDLGGNSATFGMSSWYGGGMGGSGAIRFAPFDSQGACAMFWKVTAGGLLQYDTASCNGNGAGVPNACLSAYGPLYDSSFHCVTLAACSATDVYQQWTLSSQLPPSPPLGTLPAPLAYLAFDGEFGLYPPSVQTTAPNVFGSVSFVPGIRGQAAYFNNGNSVSNYITVQNTAGSGPLSVMFWVALDPASFSFYDIRTAGFTSPPVLNNPPWLNSGMQIDFSNGQGAPWYTGWVAGAAFPTAWTHAWSQIPTTSYWTHVAVVVTAANEVIIYTNGTTTSGAMQGSLPMPGAEILVLGRSANDDGSSLIGAIDEVYLYGGALTAAQVIENMNLAEEAAEVL